MVYGAAEDGVQLPMETSKFNTFSQEDYDKVFAALASGEIVLKKDVDENGNELTLDDLGLTRVKYTLVQ